MTDKEPETLKPESEMFANGLETNLVPIAKHIFSKEPGAPYSIGLQLDHPLDSDQSPAEVISEMLHLILFVGIAIKYGSDTKLSDLSAADLQLLRRYMWSVGYDPVLEIDTETNEFVIDFKPYRCSTI